MAAARPIVSLLFLSTLSASLPFVAGGELSFLALGDWGGNELWPYTTLFEKAVSKGMSKIAENLETQFIVALGRFRVKMNLIIIYCSTLVVNRLMHTLPKKFRVDHSPKGVLLHCTSLSIGLINRKLKCTIHVFNT